VAGTAMLFRQVQEAYDVLSDPVLRGAYDRGRKEAGLSPEAALCWTFHLNRQQFPAIGEEQLVYVLVEIAGTQPMGNHERLPLNLCLTVDRSTSMQGQRLDQVKAAIYQLIDSLSSEDVLSIVTFSDRAEVVWPSQPVTDSIRIKSKVAAIQASGGTEIYQGMLAGLTELEKRRSDRSISHMLLLTDGQTYGDEERCLMEAVEAKKHTISISCLGLGDDWNDVLLDAIANRSGGVSVYIASVSEVQRLFHERVRDLSATYATTMHLTIRCAEGCDLLSAFRLAPYLIQIKPEDNVLELGSLESGLLLPVVMEFVAPAWPAGAHRLAQFDLEAELPALERGRERLRHELKLTLSQNPPEEPIPPTLLSGLSKIAVFRMQDSAWKALEAGNVPEATRRLETVATRLLDLGEQQLARAALLEAGRLARSGQLSPAGRKVIKYGTRSLSFSKERGND
jgi:Ca-activated chloride channel family protein